jgi:hypothetical protein
MEQVVHSQPQSQSNLLQTVTHITKNIDGTTVETHVQTRNGEQGYPVQNKFVVYKDAWGNEVKKHHEKREGDSVEFIPNSSLEHSPVSVVSTSTMNSNPFMHEPQQHFLSWPHPSSAEFQSNIQKYFAEVHRQQSALMSKIVHLMKKMPALDPELNALNKPACEPSPEIVKMLAPAPKVEYQFTMPKAEVVVKK